MYMHQVTVVVRVMVNFEVQGIKVVSTYYEYHWAHASFLPTHIDVLVFYTMSPSLHKVLQHQLIQLFCFVFFWNTRGA